MKTVLLDTDEAAILLIRAKASRTFDSQINTTRNLNGESFKLQVRDVMGVVILEFSVGNGLTILGSSVILKKTASEMTVPTGIYDYDLIEVSGQDVNNLITGTFHIQPSSTLP